MEEKGLALMGTGISSGDNRSIEAAQRAIRSPLLEDVSIKGAKGVLMNITASSEMTLEEVESASSLIYKEADENANIIWGTVIDDTMGDEMMITVIATGIKQDGNLMEKTEKTQSLENYKAKKEKKPQKEHQKRRMFRRLPLEEDDLDIPTFIRQRRD